MKKLHFWFVVLFAICCKQLPEIEVSPELKMAMCIDACRNARAMGCERMGQADLSDKACEPFCNDLLVESPNPDFGCMLEAVTCPELGSCNFRSR
jgi:hypothetical protein